MDKILIVGAHALDAEVMAGGIASLAQNQGIPVLLVHMTRGERGHPQKSTSDFGMQLELEMVKAASVLGVRQLWPGFKAPLSGSSKIADWLEELIVREKITTILTHWVGSWHPSHVRTYRAVVEAVTKIKENRPALFFAENGEDLAGFRAEWLIPIDTVYDQWMTALNCYELFRLSQHRPIDGNGIPYFAYYSSITRMHGLHVNRQYAQAVMCGQGEIPQRLDAINILSPT